MSTCNRLELQTLGSQSVMPKNLPNHWMGAKPQSSFYYYILHYLQLHSNAEVFIYDVFVSEKNSICRVVTIFQNVETLDFRMQI